MQQRGPHTTMNIENEEKSISSSSRGRRNSKTKVLVRSLAIREEASPPRDSSPTQLISPSIKVIPSSETSPAGSSPAHPLVVLSPSLSRTDSPVCVSPTSTLVPSPTSRSSPPETARSEPEEDNCSSPRYLSKLNRQNLEKDPKRDVASHLISKKKLICDCSNQSCIKCCVKSQEKNINNNHTNINNNVVHSSNTLTVTRVNSKNKLRQQSSSQGSFEGSSSNSPCLSRDSSSEQYTDTSGADLEVFIPETLNRNAKDRAFMLRIEQELVNLAKDKIKTHYKFPPMSSYQRMLVHRCAAYFGMDHNIESSGKCVVVNKTKNTRIPDVEFKEHIKEDIIFSEEPRRSILKRDSNSIEDYNFKSPDRQYSMENRRSKSFEEREEEYAKELCLLRQMHDAGSNEDFEWADIPWSSTDSENSSRFRLQLPEHNRRPTGKLTKVLSEETGETLRPYVAKSYSFGGYAGVLNRGDSVVSTHSAGPRLLTKQDSGASSVSWRLSPSSSGYKSQSQMSESVTPSPTSTPNQMAEPAARDSACEPPSSAAASETTRIVWAVTDIQRVPKGSVIIDPQTGEPVKNEDGSLYRYDPGNLPPGFAKPPPSPKKEAAARKSRLTNSSTSPSLPYSPPPPPPPRAQYAPPPPPPEGQYAPYGQFGGQVAHEGAAVYQQPCVVYATATPYGVPTHFEGRMEPQPLGDMGAPYYVNVAENAAPPAAQTITYQQPPPPPSYWNQQPLTFYQNAPPPNPTPPQRFPGVHPSAPPNYVSSYPPNYMPSAAQPPPPNPDLLPMFPPQPVHLLYSNQSNPVLYPNQPPNVLYAQSPLYSGPLYTPQYPQNGTPVPPGSFADVAQLTQGMAQMGLGHQASHPGYMLNKMPTPPHYDPRQKTCTPKGAKFGGGGAAPKGAFVLGSSQSSTGTNSPAATVVAGYCPQQGAAMYRTPPETPPAQFGYGPGFAVPPMLFRQVSNVRANTPGTARSSRSPTPASDVSHFDRTRIAPPNLYHGIPYVLPSDNRVIPGRGQPNPYRHAPPVKQQSFNQGSENSRNHKSRKSKGNKLSSLPSAK